MKKFNKFDLLFIILILLLSLGIFYRFFYSKDKEIFENNKTITYKAIIEQMDKDFASSLEVNDNIYVYTSVCIK